MKSKLSEPQREELITRYKAGESVGELAGAFGITHGSVGYLLRSRGIKRRPSPYHVRYEQELIVEGVRLYQTGLDGIQIEAKIGLPHAALYRALGRAGIYSHGRIPDKYWPDIRHRYANGETLSSIARSYNTKHQNIARRLRAEGIAIKPNGEAQRVHTCDDHFFERIDNERSAYWLGFIAADGCMFFAKNGGRSIVIKLAMRDAEHLAQYRADLRATNPVLHTGSNQAMISIHSSTLVDDLMEAGISPRKSLTHEWPDFLPNHMLRHYLRGYSDGDGSFYRGRMRPKRKTRQASWQLCGSKPFLRSCQSYLAEMLDFKPTKLSKNGVIHNLQYGGNRQIARLAHLFYDDATVYLARKRDIVAHLL